MLKDVFREEAVTARNERQRLDLLLQVNASHERFIVVALAVAVALFIGWAIFGGVARSLSIDGVIVTRGERQEVAVMEPGQLVDIRVSPGVRVSSGDPIAVQTVPELDREISILRNQLKLVREGGYSGQDENLESVQAALFGLEAKRLTRSLVVSHGDGVITAIYKAPGDFVSTGSAIAELRSGESQTLHAVSHLAADTAQSIETGMSAKISIEQPDGTRAEFAGEVVSVTKDTPSQWLSTLLEIPAGHLHRVDISFQDAALAVQEGMRCRIRINLGESAPIALLNFKSA